jgi:4-hydroxy-3-methylbut-2-en-1-yl diphosphate reductase
MRVILANPRGFCAGVNMAIEVVEQALKIQGPPIYVYHEIVHNRHVVEGFDGRGVIFVDDIDDVPPGQVVVYSAHGIPPGIRRRAQERRLLEVDATCPLVTKVHLEVLRFAKEGYSIVFIGHENHDEAVGTVGEAPLHIHVIESAEDVAALEVPDPNKVAYVTQTTLSVSEAASTISALKARFPSIVGPRKGDICYATTNRQTAVRELSSEADVVLVIGSRNSSNSKRLVETAAALGRPAYLIDDASELKPAWLDGKSSVLVTAGASAPEHLVQDVLDRLKECYNAVVETQTLVEERTEFELPRSLRVLAQSK